MYYTKHYQFPQWERSDRILMDDFNDMAGKIENGLLQLTGEVPRIAVGGYTGSGETPLQVSLGFRPKMVLIWHRSTASSSGTDSFPRLVAMVVDGYPLEDILTINDSGFLVEDRKGGSGYQIYPSLNSGERIYFAIG